MSNPLSIVMIGATGAVGGHCVSRLLEVPGLQRLTLLGRREVGGVQSDAIHQHRVDLFDPSSYTHLLNGHHSAICTLGVGQPSKVSKAELAKIDKVTVLDFASACRAAGVRHFVLLSAVGANAKSLSFYLRTKGELNDALKALEFERLSLFCPSMILTPTNRYGISQAILLRTWPWVQPLLIGPMRNFRGIAVEQLGAAMANTIPQEKHGTEELYWDDFIALM
ncbi:MAG: NAD(P)H-binding protein [Verrucomicrobiales bacterium]